MGISRKRGICIHAQDPRFRQEASQLFLHLLRTHPAVFHHAAAAFGAFCILRNGIPAVVAHHAAVGGMIGEGNTAVRAGQHRLAGGALDEGMVSPPVDEQDRLAPLLLIMPQAFEK